MSRDKMLPGVAVRGKSVVDRGATVDNA